MARSLSGIYVANMNSVTRTESTGEHDLLIGARRGSPLAIGYGDGEMFLGSDALALAPLTRRITYLEEGDWAVVTSRAVKIFDAANNAVDRPIREFAASGALIGKGNYRHFMQKEIFEQPAVIGDTLACVCQPGDPDCAHARATVCAGRARPDDDDRMRHRLSCLRRCQVLARADRPHYGRGRHRL